MVVVAWLKSCFKYWVLCVWVLFISLLASEAESVPKLRSVEACGGEKERKGNRKREKIEEHKKRAGRERKEDEADRKHPLSSLADVEEEEDKQEEEVDSQEPEEETTRVVVQPEKLREDETYPNVEDEELSHAESEEEWEEELEVGAEEKEDEEECVKASITLGSMRTSREEEEERSGPSAAIRVDFQKAKLEGSGEKLQRSRRRIGNANRDKSEDDDEDEDADDVPWIGLGRSTGLTRYSGVQDLLAHTGAENEPLVVEKRAPVLMPRREGPLLLPRSSLVRSLSYEKDRLEEIPEEERQSSSVPEDGSGNDQDKIWAQLVAKYAEEPTHHDYNGGEEAPYRESSVEKGQSEKQQESDERYGEDSVFILHSAAVAESRRDRNFIDENMMSEEFSTQVGKRLHMYLARLEEHKEEESAEEVREEDAPGDGTREIEDDALDNFEVEDNGRNKIFIMIEDDDSNGDEALKKDGCEKRAKDELTTDDRVPSFPPVEIVVESAADEESDDAVCSKATDAFAGDNEEELKVEKEEAFQQSTIERFNKRFKDSEENACTDSLVQEDSDGTHFKFDKDEKGSITDFSPKRTKGLNLEFDDTKKEALIKSLEEKKGEETVGLGEPITKTVTGEIEGRISTPREEEEPLSDSFSEGTRKPYPELGGAKEERVTGLLAEESDVEAFVDLQGTKDEQRHDSFWDGAEECLKSTKSEMTGEPAVEGSTQQENLASEPFLKKSKERYTDFEERSDSSHTPISLTGEPVDELHMEGRYTQGDISLDSVLRKVDHLSYLGLEQDKEESTEIQMEVGSSEGYRKTVADMSKEPIGDVSGEDIEGEHHSESKDMNEQPVFVHSSLAEPTEDGRRGESDEIAEGTLIETSGESVVFEETKAEMDLTMDETEGKVNLDVEEGKRWQSEIASPSLKQDFIDRTELVESSEVKSDRDRTYGEYSMLKDSAEAVTNATEVSKPNEAQVGGSKIEESSEQTLAAEVESHNKQSKTEEMEAKEGIKTEASDTKEDVPVFTIKLRRKSKPVIIPEEPVVEEIPEVTFNIPVRRKSSGEECLRKKAIENLRRKNSGDTLFSAEMRETMIVDETCPVEEPIKEIAKEKSKDEKTHEKADLEKVDTTLSPDMEDGLMETVDNEGRRKEEEKNEPGWKEQEEMIRKEEKGIIQEEEKEIIKEEEKEIIEEEEEIIKGEKKEIIEEEEENEHRCKVLCLLKRRSSRDLWKMECEKLLEVHNKGSNEDAEVIQKPDIFSTRYEEFPEDYVSLEALDPSCQILDDIGDGGKERAVNEQFGGRIGEERKQEDELREMATEVGAGFVGMENAYLASKELPAPETPSSGKRKDEGEEGEVFEEDVGEAHSKRHKGEMHRTTEEDLEITPKPASLATVCNLLTVSEQDLVARILAQKSKEDDRECTAEESLYKDYWGKEDNVGQRTKKDASYQDDEYYVRKRFENVGFLEGESSGRSMVRKRDEMTPAVEKGPPAADMAPVIGYRAVISQKGEEVADGRIPGKTESSPSEKELMLGLIRLERGSEKRGLSDEEIPDYLEEVKDLLVPRARRKKAKKRLSVITDILKIEESEVSPTAYPPKSLELQEEVSSRKDALDDVPGAEVEKELSSGVKDEFLLTKEETRVFDEIKKEQEAYREAQRKELEKYLAMPDALTLQEQQELEELLAEEESNKALTTASEARLEAFLAEVRKRLGSSEMDLEDDENLDRYMDLPVGLTEEEEKLLFTAAEEDEEKGLRDFETEDEYREYVRQRYLNELEEERLRVEEEEMELGGYYDDDYDYGDLENDDYDEDFGGDFILMEEEGEAKGEGESRTLKDEAVGPDDPMEGREQEEEEEEETEDKAKEGKHFFNLRSSRGASSKRSRGSLERTSSKDSSLEECVEDETTKESFKASKKFFRYGGLAVKRKKKSDEELRDSLLTGGEEETGMIEKLSLVADGTPPEELKNEKPNIFSHPADHGIQSGGTKAQVVSSEEGSTGDFHPHQVSIELEEKSSAQSVGARESDAIEKSPEVRPRNENNLDAPEMPPASTLEPPERIVKEIDECANGVIRRDKGTARDLSQRSFEKLEGPQEGSVKEVLQDLSNGQERRAALIGDDVTEASMTPGPESRRGIGTTGKDAPEDDWEIVASSDDEAKKAMMTPVVNMEEEFVFVRIEEGREEDKTRGDDTTRSKDAELGLDHVSGGRSISAGVTETCNDVEPGGKGNSPQSVDWEQRKAPAEVSDPEDTAMSRRRDFGRSSAAPAPAVNGERFKKPGRDEDLWPEEKKTTTSKVVIDEFQKMEQEVILEMEKNKKEGDKKGKQKKKKKKGDAEKENKKTAYQNKEGLLEKHVGPRIRSFDTAKMKSKFSKPKEPTQVSSECRICGKQVFQMEKIVAEKASWHKNCFRCKECNKNLTLETYQSHEGMLYCKPHFKELFRPKAVVQDEAEERKDRLMRRPRMIILESQPEALPDDVVRATDKPDYGLEELQQTLNVKQRFSMFENMTKESEKPKTEPISVRRSQSLMSKAARFLDGHDDKGDIDGEYDEEEMEEEEEAEEEEEEEEEEEGDENEASHIVRSNRRKKERPMSFSGMGDLKAVWEQKQRREEMSQSRKEEIAKFRQMLCAGKNSLLKEKFESGIFDEDVEDDEEGGKRRQPKEQIKIEGKRAASNLMKKFERGEPFILEDEEDDGEEYEEDEYEEGEEEDGTPLRRRKRRETLCSEKKEVEEIFKEAETAKKARNVFKQIDSHVAQEGGGPILRSQSFATAATLENRRSLDASLLMHQSNPTPENVEVVKSGEKDEEYQVDTTDLASRFRFFLDYEKNKEKERETKRKVFRITPPREGTDQVLQDVALTKANMPKPCMAVNCAVCKLIRGMQGSEDLEVLGRDPNLIKCTDNYQDEVDCRNTKNILQMFRKMEMGNDDEEEEDEGPRPLKRFTPPPDAREYEDDSDYSDEYSDEEDEDDEEEEEEDEDGNRRPQIRDELLQMKAAPPQSARKAASLRAKFERWEAEVERNNDLNSKEKEELEECMPSLDTAKNLRAMFEHKANEVVKPVASKPIAQKINRFV